MGMSRVRFPVRPISKTNYSQMVLIRLFQVNSVALVLIAKGIWDLVIGVIVWHIIIVLSSVFFRFREALIAEYSDNSYLRNVVL